MEIEPQMLKFVAPGDPREVHIPEEDMITPNCMGHSSMLENLKRDSGVLKEAIEIEDATYESLCLIRDFVKNHGKEKAPEVINAGYDVSEWADLVDIPNREILKSLVNATNFLGMETFLQITLVLLARMFKGKTSDEIKKEWGLPDVLTDAQMNYIKTYHGWIYNKHH